MKKRGAKNGTRAMTMTINLIGSSATRLHILCNPFATIISPPFPTLFTWHTISHSPLDQVGNRSYSVFRFQLLVQIGMRSASRMLFGRNLICQSISKKSGLTGLQYFELMKLLRKVRTQRVGAA
jgi:hypothetical protein